MEAVSPKRDNRVVELVNRLGRAVHCMQFSRGLNPAQWEALRFVARANRYSRTPSALAGFLGTTKGTASQTVKALEAKGYVQRLVEPCDRRMCRLEITEAGRAILNLDPMLHVAAALEDGAIDTETLSVGLTRLLNRLAERCHMSAFGVCCRCAHFGLDEAREARDGPHRCGLTGDPLSEGDMAQICVNQTPATPGSGARDRAEQ